MAKIIRLDVSRSKPAAPGKQGRSDCDHKNVIVYRVARTVRCAVCGALLDPFEVLVELVQTMPPPPEPDEDKRFMKEMVRRKPPSQDKE
jgi:hypothetical protein